MQIDRCQTSRCAGCHLCIHLIWASRELIAVQGSSAAETQYSCGSERIDWELLLGLSALYIEDNDQTRPHEGESIAEESQDNIGMIYRV